MQCKFQTIEIRCALIKVGCAPIKIMSYPCFLLFIADCGTIPDMDNADSSPSHATATVQGVEVTYTCQQTNGVYRFPEETLTTATVKIACNSSGIWEDFPKECKGVCVRVCVRVCEGYI